MKKIIRILVVTVAVLSLLTSQMALAKSGNGKGNGQNKEQSYSQDRKQDNQVDNQQKDNQEKDKDNKGLNYGQSKKQFEKNLNNFTIIKGERVKVNNKHVNFDTPPMIKEGRTLIPVRAVTEALGGSVAWDKVKFVATIISPDGLIKVTFDLSEEGGGRVRVYDQMGLDDDEIIWKERPEVVLDVNHGLYNNRTFVPLRFLAETFGLGIGYNEESGQIDITKEPKLAPRKVIYEEFVDIDEDLEVYILLYDYVFTGIDGLSEGVEFEVESLATTAPSLKITIDEDYIEGLEDEETILEFTFESGLKNIIEEFKMTLEFLD